MYHWGQTILKLYRYTHIYKSASTFVTGIRLKFLYDRTIGICVMLAALYIVSYTISYVFIHGKFCTLISIFFHTMCISVLNLIIRTPHHNGLNFNLERKLHLYLIFRVFHSGFTTIKDCSRLKIDERFTIYYEMV